MRLREKKRREAQVPTDSMSDIAFLLIIFFIVATTLNQYKGFKMEIPAGEKGQTQEKTPTVKLNGKQILMGEKKVTLKELRKQLQELRLKDKVGQDKVVMLEATKTVTYQLYFTAMAAITNAGGAVTIIQEED